VSFKAIFLDRQIDNRTDAGEDPLNGVPAHAFLDQPITELSSTGRGVGCYRSITENTDDITSVPFCCSEEGSIFIATLETKVETLGI
jgi:hypothetical protein